MKVLVVGNAGFIGSFLTSALLEEGHEVRGMDVDRPEDGERRYTFIRGSVLDNGDIFKAAQGCEVIINLAAKHHDFGVAEEEFFGVNEQGVRIFLIVRISWELENCFSIVAWQCMVIPKSLLMKIECPIR